MRELADDLHVLGGLTPYAINVYLVSDVLVDAATRRAGSRSCASRAGARSPRTR